MTTEEVLLQTFSEHPGAILLGVGFCILCFYIGMGILLYGWPKLRRKK